MRELRVLLYAGFLLALVVLLQSCTGRSERMLAMGTGEIELRLLGFRNANGHALISLFNGSDGFPDRVDKSVLTQELKIDGDRARIHFGSLPWGRYAISVLHDENGDGRMNSSWLGTPLEGFGLSGHPEYRFGQPGYDDASFLLASEQREITIKLRYSNGQQQRRQHNRDTNLIRQST